MALNRRPLLQGTILAAGAITAFRAVGYDGNQVSAQGGKVRGIAQFAASEGDYLAITEKGTELMECGAALNPGDLVIADNQGRAIKANALAIVAGATAVTSAAANGATDITGSEPSEHPIGRALAATTAAGQLVEILLI